MFDVGFFEIILIATVTLVVVGPEQLPKAARLTGALLGKFRRTAADLRVAVEKEIEYQELKERLDKSEAQLHALHSELDKPIEAIEAHLSGVEHELTDTHPEPIQNDSSKITDPPQHNSGPHHGQ